MRIDRIGQTRDELFLGVNGRRVTLIGELLFPPSRPSMFFVYPDAPWHWEDGTLVGPSERAEIWHERHARADELRLDIDPDEIPVPIEPRPRVEPGVVLEGRAAGLTVRGPNGFVVPGWYDRQGGWPIPFHMDAVGTWMDLDGRPLDEPTRAQAERRLEALLADRGIFRLVRG